MIPSTTARSLRRQGRSFSPWLALLALTGCSGAPPVHMAAPRVPVPAPVAKPERLALFARGGIPSFHPAAPESPGAVSLERREAAPCVLDGWVLEPGGRTLRSTTAPSRELDLPAESAIHITCNGHFVAQLDADGTLWIVDASNGRVEHTALPLSASRFAECLPIVDEVGNLRDTVLVTHDGQLWRARGPELTAVPLPKLTFHGPPVATQLGDTLVLASELTYVLSLRRNTLEGILYDALAGTWITPGEPLRRRDHAPFSGHRPKAVEEQPTVAYEGALYGAAGLGPALLAQGGHHFVLRLVKPVLDPVVSVHEQRSTESAYVRRVTVASGGHVLTDTRPEPSGAQAEPLPLHTITEEIDVYIECGCDGSAPCEGLCALDPLTVQATAW